MNTVARAVLGGALGRHRGRLALSVLAIALGVALGFAVAKQQCALGLRIQAPSVLQLPRVGPSRLAHRLSELRQAAQAGQHEREGHLRHRAAVGPRQVAHRDAAPLRRLDIDRVHAAADFLDQLELRRASNDLGRHRFQHVPEHVDLRQPFLETGDVALGAQIDAELADSRSQRVAAVEVEYDVHAE